MHSVLLGDNMSLPVPRNPAHSVVEETIAPATHEDKELSPVADDDISPTPSLRSSPDPLDIDKDGELSSVAGDDILSIPSPRSSPDLPDITEFLAQFKRARSPLPTSPSSLPCSSLPSSPDAYRRSISPGNESHPGQVFFYDMAGEDPWFFKVPSTNGYFSLLSSKAFLGQTQIVTHALKVYDTMTGDFVGLPPTAFWRQFSIDQYMIVKEVGVADADCPGLELLIEYLDDPVDLMSKDDDCRHSWHRDRDITPPSDRTTVSIPSPVHRPSYTEQGAQTTGGYKRKRAADEDKGLGPPAKIRKGRGTFDDPIMIFDD
ncbi:hypothetical protein Agabi119p4_7040 [Agaricus bisporus var. burnettii]|uniref:Uncharacterized protein n=2 Tax=Agaricus bisporus var. burnettii TaxID=192524 RepID=A0A8H7C0H6_AGABI|nr:hypothetical protein Agabi119p4_11220 [Agaricus bisporus var. burnettii]KAF7771066.1 hypothetical protein Agabi119p4_7040 [Agaricus bisporus var. burnettii]